MEIVHCILRSRKTAILAMGIYGIYLEQLFAIYKHSHIEPCVLCTQIVRQTKSKICIACRAQKLNCTYFDLLPKCMLSSKNFKVYFWLFRFVQCKNSDNKIAVKFRPSPTAAKDQNSTKTDTMCTECVLFVYFSHVLAYVADSIIPTILV